MSYSRTFVFQSTTGLTLEALLRNTSGTAVGSAVSTGFYEEGSTGWYMWTGTIPDGHQGCVVFRSSGGGAVRSVHEINPGECENMNVRLSDGVPLSLSQSVPFSNISSNATQTVGDCLSAARAGAAGKLVVAGTTITLYGPDGTTVVRQFNTNDPVWPSSRS